MIIDSIISASYAMNDPESLAALSNLIDDLADMLAKDCATFDKAEFIRKCGL